MRHLKKHLRVSWCVCRKGHKSTANKCASKQQTERYCTIVPLLFFQVLPTCLYQVLSLKNGSSIIWVNAKILYVSCRSRKEKQRSSHCVIVNSMVDFHKCCYLWLAIINFDSNVKLYIAKARNYFNISTEWLTVSSALHVMWYGWTPN